MKIATPMAIVTHIEATRLDNTSLPSSSIAINLTKMCGMPKYPIPQANNETADSAEYGTAVPATASWIAEREK